MKKGFTLVELLAVIVILALIAVITIPLVTNTIKNSKESLGKRQIESIEKASENWFMRQKYSIPAGSNKIYVVELDTLIDEGYLDKSKVVDPTGEIGVEDPDDPGQKILQGCVKISFDKNQYKYNYESDQQQCSCSNCELIPDQDSNE